MTETGICMKEKKPKGRESIYRESRILKQDQEALKVDILACLLRLFTEPITKVKPIQGRPGDKMYMALGLRREAKKHEGI